MKKIAIILDSFSGRTKKNVESKQDMFYIPLQVDIDGIVYKSGVDSTELELMKKTNISKSPKTSMPTGEDLTSVFEKTSKEYENVIYLCLSRVLSGTFNVATVIAKDFDNVEVVDSISVGKTFTYMAEKIQKLSNEGKSYKEIRTHLDEYIAAQPPTFIIPKSVEALIRSGRMGRTIGLLLERINAVPIISFEDNVRLHKKSLKRSGKKAVDFVIDKLVKIKESLGSDYKFIITHTLNTEVADYAKEKIESMGEEVIFEITSSLINVNVGDGAFSLGLTKK